MWLAMDPKREVSGVDLLALSCCPDKSNNGKATRDDGLDNKLTAFNQGSRQRERDQGLKQTQKKKLKAEKERKETMVETRYEVNIDIWTLISHSRRHF